MNDNEQADIELLRAWRCGSTSRILVTSADGSVRLIEYRMGVRWDSDHESASAAVQALATGCVHWVQRSAPEPNPHPLRRRFPERVDKPAPAPRELSQTPRAIRQRAYRARRASAAPPQ